ncbi:MAG TPA: cytochrome c [Gammaproteobacteria bacterium]|nr:cytochrome c [Gammaproteobacteria bacterium]
MRAGEKGIIIGIVVVVLGMAGYRATQVLKGEKDPGIPFYTTATPELKRQAELIYKENKCSACHSLWMVRSIMENVPAPRLDGIGSLKDEAWFYRYLSAENPQEILPSRLKQEYQMPSYAHLPEEQRRALAAYLASLKVEDWYLEETRRTEFEKLRGKGERYVEEQ